MQSILEKACQTLASGETVTPASFKGTIGNQAVPDVGTMKDFCPPLNFSQFQDLNLYGGDQIDRSKPRLLKAGESLYLYRSICQQAASLIPTEIQGLGWTFWAQKKQTHLQ